MLSLIFTFVLMMSRYPNSNGDDFSTDYCPYVSQMSSSEDSIIYANMQTSKFYVTTQSEMNGTKCDILFNDSSVCGLSIGKNQNLTKRWFIYWGYDDDIDQYYIRTVYYSELTSKKCLYNYTDKIYSGSDVPVFKTLDDGSLAYGFDYNYFYYYNPQMNTLNRTTSTGGSLTFTPSDIAVTKAGDKVIAVGYLQDVRQMFASVCLWNINIVNSSMIISDCKRLHNIGYHFSEYHPGPKLSVDLNHNLIAIGNSANRTIEIFMFNDTELFNTHTFTSNVETNSICWLPDGYRIAVVAPLIATSPWSQSQIQIYDLNLTMYHWPQYVFPNNQQQLDSWSFKNPVFILVAAWKQWNSLIISMDTGKVLVILSTEAGSYADPLLYSWFDNPWVWVGLRNRRLNEQSSTPCWPGMYKQENNILSCNVCPPKTKSSTNATICTPCDQSLFCPLASVDDIDTTDMIDVHHITSFPQSSDSAKFEDVLITNMFSIQSSPHCIIVSPLFWTLIVIMMIILFLLVIGILKFFPNSHKHRAMIKKIFRQTDFIGEGELWIGGLMSYSLFVLVIFAFLFSNEYGNLYPIEESPNASLACDRNLRNAQFDTSLKLLVATRTEEDQIIFDMLDNQQFTLSIHFVNTNFNCDLFSILQGTGDNLHEPINPLTCVDINASQIVFTSILAPHETTFKYKVNHFAPIGALYICLTGSGNVTDDGLNTIQDLHFCKWISRENETIGYLPDITILNTKIINRTDNLVQGQPTKSSGIWQPNFIGSELSDQNLYNHQGEYHRYLSSETVLTIILDENHFYLENSQSPVARKTEVSFHTILFVSMALEIFCLTFLIFKLIFVPLFRLMERQILLCYGKISPVQSFLAETHV